MTEVLTRQPLEQLSMASSQRGTRRRSSRGADGDDDAPPAKKAKVDDTARGTVKQVNGRKNATTSKQRKDVNYDEDRDGFNFSRRKKPANMQTHQENEIQPSNGTDKTARGRPGRRKRASAESRASEGESVPRRRSARLSGEHEPDAQREEKTSKAKEVDRGVQHAIPSGEPKQKTSKPPRPPDDELQVDKKRATTKIALPFADTPVISRNKEMRKTSSESRRRSSSGMRGRRASSLIDSGVSNAVPHNEVRTEEFYKHISQDLHEPRRMMQLLTWCGARAVTDKPSDQTGDVNAVLAARTIQEELLKDFTAKSEMSDWFNRDETITPAVLVKKPNPRNQQNAARIQELELEVKRLEQEMSTWDTLLNSLSSSLKAEPSTEKPESSGPSSGRTVNENLLKDADQVECLRQLSSRPNATEITRARLKNASESLEIKVDQLANGVHKLSKLDEVIDRTLDAVSEDAATALSLRDEAKTGGASKEKSSIRDVLRALSRA